MLQQLLLLADWALSPMVDSGLLLQSIDTGHMDLTLSHTYGGLLQALGTLCTKHYSWCDHISNRGCRRHAFGDQYRATDIPIPGPGKLELVYHPQDGSEPQRFEVHNFDGKGALSARAPALRLLSLQLVHAVQTPLPTVSNIHALWPHHRCQSGCSHCCPTEIDAQRCRLHHHNLR